MSTLTVNKKDIEITKALIKFSDVYKKYRTIKHNNFDLNFAVKCATEDLFNALKYYDKKDMIKAIENEIVEYTNDINSLKVVS